MLLNPHSDRLAVVHAGRQPWTASPAPGVERIPLARRGAEVAVATTVVRYAAGAAFPAHTHGGGEEYLVLEGVFSDETGDHAAGTYVRNPPGSRHAPFTRGGCVIAVRLCQFAEQDRDQVCIPAARGRVHTFGATEVWVEEVGAGDERIDEGLHESFVVSGADEDDHGLVRERWTWVRLPPGARRVVRAREPTVRWVTRWGFDPWAQ